MAEPTQPDYSLSKSAKIFIFGSIGMGILACISLVVAYAMFGENVEKNKQARAVATAQPISTATPKPSATPRPTQTRKPTQTPKPTQAPKPGPTVKPTSIPWDVTVKELAEMPLPSIPKPQSFETVKPRALLTSELGRAVAFSGKGFQLETVNGRLIVAIETSSLMFYSEPVLVVSQSPLIGQQDFRNLMLAEGVFIGTVLASNRWGENAQTPVVLAFRVQQTNTRYDFEPLPLR